MLRLRAGSRVVLGLRVVVAAFLSRVVAAAEGHDAVVSALADPSISS